jgi:predicted acylesterase/phospholipase RssA
VRLVERFEITRPLEEMEIALVRGAITHPGLVDAHEEAILRTALSLARLYVVRQDGMDLRVGGFLAPFREDVARRFGPVLLPKEGHVQRELVRPLLDGLKERTLALRQGLLHRFEGRLSPEALDAELRQKALVMVLGGGGGTAYPYVGVMALLDEYGLVPKLLVGTSMGSILGLFRSRMRRFEQEEIVSIVRSLTWRKLFRLVSTENRYGVPAALRLYLRAGIGRWFGVDHRGGEAVRLEHLPIKTIIATSGIRRGKLPKPLDFYERLVAASPLSLLNPLVLPRWFAALSELVSNPDILCKVHFGVDDETKQLDALDAAGFSSALPGVIHYDVLRDDPRTHGLLQSVMEKHRVFRFVDGGLVDNVPAKAAWRAVHKGQIGTRNAFILALNGFSMKLTTPVWLPLQRIAEINVSRNRPFAHLMHDFRKTLSPLEIVPSVEALMRAIEIGRKTLLTDVPFLTRMLAPLPRLAHAP